MIDSILVLSVEYGVIEYNKEFERVKFPSAPHLAPSWMVASFQLLILPLLMRSRDDKRIVDD